MGWFNNLSVRYKILIIPLVGTIGFCCFLWLSSIDNRQATERLGQIRDVYFPLLEKANANQVRLGMVISKLNDAVTMGEKDILDEAQQLHEQTLEGFEQQRSLMPDAVSDINATEKSYSDFYAAAHKLTETMLSGTANMAGMSGTIQEKNNLQMSAENALKNFRESSHSQFVGLVKASETASQNTLQLNLLIGGVTIFVLAMTAFAVALAITGSVGRVVDSLRDIAEGEGDLTRRITVRSQDEIGDLVHWFNTFVEKMQMSLIDVVDVIEPLSKVSQELKGVTEKTNQDSIAQSHNADSVSQSMQDLIASFHEMAARASATSEAAVDADQESQQGRTIVASTVTSINELAVEVDEAAAVIQQLEKDAENVGGILDVIRGIAEQTNLLALNAAIEAARAGEQGRGFAVVADEVRTLASRTQHATSEIRKVIEQLQGAAGKAVTVMDHSKRCATLSVEHASKTGDSLVTITGKVATISEMNHQIAEQTQRQQGSSAVISEKMTHMRDVAEQTRQSTEHVAGLSISLEDFAAKLHRVAKQFKVA